MASRRKLSDPQSAGLKSTLVKVAAELASNPRSIKLPTMRDIAKEAGVAPGAAYRHFESQDELFIEVIRFLFAELEDKLNKAVAGSPNSGEKLERLVRAYVNWGLTNPGSYQLLFETTDEMDMPLPDERPGLHLITQLAILISDKPKPGKTSIQKAIQIWMSLHGLISLRLHKTGMNWQNSIDKDVDQIVKAFKR